MAKSPKRSLDQSKIEEFARRRAGARYIDGKGVIRSETERDMRLRRARLLAKSAAWTTLLATLGITGCGGGGSGGGSPIQQPVGPNAVLFVSAPPTSLAVNASATLMATATFPIANSGGNTAVTWAVTCGSPGGCGTFGPSADAAGITYTAPAAIPAGATVTVTATSVADTGKFADYPTLGVDANALYIGVNIFNVVWMKDPRLLTAENSFLSWRIRQPIDSPIPTVIRVSFARCTNDGHAFCQHHLVSCMGMQVSATHKACLGWMCMNPSKNHEILRVNVVEEL